MSRFSVSIGRDLLRTPRVLLRPMCTAPLRAKRKDERIDSVDSQMLADRESHAERMLDAWPDPAVEQKIKKLKLGRAKRWHNQQSAEARRRSLGAKMRGHAHLMGRTGVGMHADWERFNRESLSEVALLGHSNCGKSALLNALTGSSVKRGPAGVHARAGWTAELSFFRVFPAESQMPSQRSASHLFGPEGPPARAADEAAIAANPASGHGAKMAVVLVDTPGYGFTVGNSKQLTQWGELISDYLDHSPRLKLVVLLIDSTRGVCDADKRVIRRVRQSGIPILPLLTKTDLLTPGELAQSHAVVAQDLDEITVHHRMERSKQGPDDCPRIITSHTPLMVSSHFYLGVPDLWKTLRRELKHIALREERAKEQAEISRDEVLLEDGVTH